MEYVAVRAVMIPVVHELVSGSTVSVTT